MDGVSIIRAVLTANAGVTALVPPDRIEAGTLPIGTQLDAIGIISVSSNDRNILAPRSTRHVSERVEVTAMAATYPRKKALLKAIKAAAADFVGEVDGASGVTILTAGTGPDVMDANASIFMGSQDFMVGFSEVR